MREKLSLAVHEYEREGANMAKSSRELKLERIVLGADRNTAQQLRKLFMKVLSKDKKSDGMNLSYVYRPFRKKAEYTIEGHPKTVLKCLGAFGKFVKKQEKIALKVEMQRAKAQPIPTGKYYTMKPAKERKKH